MRNGFTFKIKNLRESLQSWHDYRFYSRHCQVARESEITMRNIQRGFTLIELMIVIGIIGVLAALAIPAYMDYTIRAQVGEGVYLISSAKVAVAEYYQDTGAFPTDNATAGLEAAANITGKYVSQVAVAGGGLIEVTYGNDVNAMVNNTVLTFTATDTSGSLTWACAGDATLLDKWLPQSCR